jgi:hypothetical protein
VKVASSDAPGASGATYSSLLELPDTLAQLDTKIGVGSVAQRLTVSRSKIVLANGSRIIERREILVSALYPKGGYYWKTIDFLPSRGAQHASNNASAAAGDGQEIIFSLPNGVHGYYLADSNGNRVDAGPPNLVLDRNAKAKVRLAGSCFSCHADGLREDLVPDASNSTLVGALATDNLQYRIVARPLGEFSSEPIFGTVRAYERDLEFWQTAAELGLSGGALAEKIKGNAEVRTIVPDREATLKRSVLETNLVTLSGIVCPRR